MFKFHRETFERALKIGQRGEDLWNPAATNVGPDRVRFREIDIEVDAHLIEALERLGVQRQFADLRKG